MLCLLHWHHCLTKVVDPTWEAGASRYLSLFAMDPYLAFSSSIITLLNGEIKFILLINQRITYLTVSK